MGGRKQVPMMRRPSRLSIVGMQNRNVFIVKGGLVHANLCCLSYEAYVDSYEEQHHSMEPERIAADLMNHNMSDSHIGTIGRAFR